VTNRNAQRAQGFDIAPYQAKLVAAEPEFRRLAVAAKRGADYHREVNFALSKVKESEQLQKCSPDSFQEALENLGSMGLTLNPNLGQAALVPRWNTKRNMLWVTAMPMYRGFIALATGGPKIKNVWGAVVLEGDEIKVTLGSHPKVEHAPKIGRPKGEGLPSPKNVLGAYVCAEIYGSSEVHATWMDIDDILACAERSDSYNPKPRKRNNETYTPNPSGPWITDFGQMCVKTVFRRAWKTWPGIDTPEYEALQAAVRVDTQAEIMDHGSVDEVEPDEQGSATLVLTAEQAKELEALALERRCRPATILKAYGVDSFNAIPASKFAEVRARIDGFGRSTR
jgi:recombination protein RecT